jgi:hypothetical protein
MATNYTFFGSAAQLPYDAFGFCVLKKNINVANLVATDFGKLALRATPTVGLTSFTSFDGTASDTLDIFRVPAGTLVTQMGIRVSTAFTTNVDISLGDSDDSADWMAAYDADSTGNKITLVGDGYGAGTLMGKLYTSASNLTATFATAAAVVGVADFWAVCHKVY